MEKITAIDFGEPVLAADLAEDRSGSFKVSMEDIYSDKEGETVQNTKERLHTSEELLSVHEPIDIVTHSLRSKRRNMQESPQRKKWTKI